eukprot:1578185-Rhodomonas_salina.1
MSLIRGHAVCSTRSRVGVEYQSWYWYQNWYYLCQAGDFSALEQDTRSDVTDNEHTSFKS